jgi:hypothetical protein
MLKWLAPTLSSFNQTTPLYSICLTAIIELLVAQMESTGDQVVQDFYYRGGCAECLGLLCLMVPLFTP